MSDELTDADLDHFEEVGLDRREEVLALIGLAREALRARRAQDTPSDPAAAEPALYVFERDEWDDGGFVFFRDRADAEEYAREAGTRVVPLYRDRAPGAVAAAGYIDVVFDGPPGPVSGRFVEVEDPSGTSVSCGTWVDRGDGMWALRLPDRSSIEEDPCVKAGRHVCGPGAVAAAPEPARCPSYGGNGEYPPPSSGRCDDCRGSGAVAAAPTEDEAWHHGGGLPEPHPAVPHDEGRRARIEPDELVTTCDSCGGLLLRRAPERAPAPSAGEDERAGYDDTDDLRAVLHGVAARIVGEDNPLADAFADAAAEAIVETPTGYALAPSAGQDEAAVERAITAALEDLGWDWKPNTNVPSPRDAIESTIRAALAAARGPRTQDGA